MRIPSLRIAVLMPTLMILVAGCVFSVPVRPPELSAAQSSNQQQIKLEVVGANKFDRLIKDMGAMCLPQDYRLDFAEGARAAIEKAVAQKFPKGKNGALTTTPSREIRVSIDELNIKFRCPITSSLSMVCKSDARVRLSAEIIRSAADKTTLSVSKTAKAVGESGGHCSIGSAPLAQSISESFEGALQELINKLDGAVS